jgi:hypothetical protein
LQRSVRMPDPDTYHYAHGNCETNINRYVHPNPDDNENEYANFHCEQDIDWHVDGDSHAHIHTNVDANE